jgi:hypothetical protein
VLPLLLAFFYQASNVKANSPAINKGASTGIGISMVTQGNWPDWLNWTTREDVNLDLRVDITDVALCAHAFSSRPGDPRWNPFYDINNDSRVDIYDIAVVAKKFGWKGSTP